jgi:SM-20-related protein
VLVPKRGEDTERARVAMQGEDTDPVPAAALSELGEGEPVVRDGVLGPAAATEVRAAVLEARARGELRPAGLGRDRHPRERLRSDLIVWIDPAAADPRLRPLLERFEQLQAQLNRDAWLGLRRFEVQLAAYDEGPGYVRHADAFRGASSRRLTAIYYANPDWHPHDGGELRCWPPSGPRVLEPVADRLVLFLSERLEHEVAPVQRGPRVAVTAWFWGP